MAGVVESIAKAIRTVVKAAAIKENKRVTVDIVEE